jgi:hypothetical protein
MAQDMVAHRQENPPAGAVLGVRVGDDGLLKCQDCLGVASLTEENDPEIALNGRARGALTQCRVHKVRGPAWVA